MKISALLIDLDGTIYSKGEVFPQAKIALEKISSLKIPYKFITNTTTKTQKKLLKSLKELGIGANSETLFTAPKAALNFCKSQNLRNVKLVLQDDSLEEDFQELSLVSKNPEAVILGDLGNKFSLETLNPIFQDLMNGAKLIALHKNRFWESKDSLTMDLGCFVSALEFASNTKAVVCGKPSKDFFELAISDWDLPKEEIAIIGDDIETDVFGGQNTGLKGILVKTGKFNQNFVNRSGVKPDLILQNFGEILNYF
ncbi:MAG: TIGR01458 family HAD-type hydrolase [Calditrichaeota bacterium]|nr:MAG: TIGR01458 family HAD-type hydrolase [Calditrichota bacterium]